MNKQDRKKLQEIANTLRANSDAKNNLKKAIEDYERVKEEEYDVAKQQVIDMREDLAKSLEDQKTELEGLRDDEQASSIICLRDFKTVRKGRILKLPCLRWKSKSKRSTALSTR